jgi:XRE family aerobic/anaerobic benzoate catabolism transcriptional regulator
LHALGAAVRARRAEHGLTQRDLAKRAGVSERFLAQLETGEGNISVARLQDLAEALRTTAAELLAAGAQLVPGPGGRAGRAPAMRGVVSLLGVRGAGKSTLGPEVARRLGVPFVELDALVAREAGMPLATIFEMHGEAYFRRLERDVLRTFLDANEAAVIATGGSIVTAPETFDLLRRRTVTVWLKARARDHWDRVVRQGDVRPMRNRANAMSELRTLLETRRSLYAMAEHVVDTSNATQEEATLRIVAAVGRGMDHGRAEELVVGQVGERKRESGHARQSGDRGGAGDRVDRGARLRRGARARA